jgi:protocatechuate 3,4-dioxygenase beta subunit
MRRPLFALLAAISLASTPVAYRASAQVMPPRDRAAAPAEKGTGVIRGFVVDAQTAEPLPRAIVQLIPMATGPQTSPVLTDGEGRFEFLDLPAGRYLLRANRVPYLPLTYGQRGPDTRGTPIELAGGQRVEKINIAMSPGGVISGRVYDEFGYPAVGVEVRAMQYRYENGQRQLSPVYSAGFGSGGSDDLGAFRIWGLTPGTYYVSAIPRQLENVSARPIAVRTGPITTYFPSTADEGAAQRVPVDSGKETGGVNITLVSDRLAVLRGRAVSSTGEPLAGASITVSRQEGSGTRGFGGPSLNPDGTFEVSGISPGQYLLTVRTMNPRDDGTVEMARARVTVTGDDVDDIVLVGSLGATMRGVITTDEGIMPPLKPSQMMVRVEPVPEDRGTFVRPPVVNDDYSFEMKGLFGRGRIEINFVSVGMSPPGPPDAFWAIKTVYWRGQDVTARYIDFDASRTIDEIEIVFSRRWAEVSGTVTNERGQPVPDAAFVIFPTDESSWAPEARRARPTRTTPEGTFRMLGLHPGEYLIAFTGPIEPGRWQDPDYLRSLVERATRVSVLDGEKKTVNLRISTAQ